MANRKVILVIDDRDYERDDIISVLRDFEYEGLIEIIEADRVDLDRLEIRLVSDNNWRAVYDLGIDFIVADNGLGAQEGISFLEVIEDLELQSILISASLRELTIERGKKIKGCIGVFGRTYNELEELKNTFDKWLRGVDVKFEPELPEVSDELELKGRINYWRFCNQELGKDLNQITDFVHKLLEEEPRTSGESDAAELLCQGLECAQIIWRQQGELRAEEVTELLEKVSAGISKLESESDFYGLLHKLRNDLFAIRGISKEIQGTLQRYIADIEAADIDEGQAAVEDLREVLNQGVNLNSLSALEKAISKWEHIIQQVEAPPPEDPTFTPSYPIKKILIVEDQLVWLKQLEAAVRKIAQDVKVFTARTFDEACKLLEEIRKDTLVILDLGLPKDEVELNDGKSNRRWGREFLSKIRDYPINLRTIIITAPGDFLSDHKMALNMGVRPEDYILKSEEDCGENIENSIKSAIEREEVIEYIEIFEDTEQLVKIDGVEVNFDPMHFRTFSTLCGPQIRYFNTCEEISALCGYCSYNSENIHDHIYRIRKKVQEAFNRVGRTIHPEISLIETGIKRGKFAYKVVVPPNNRRFTLLKDRSSTSTIVQPYSVLVVENDPTWSQRIATILRDLRYQVEIAKNVEDAVAQAESLKPDILCLDMHLPETREEFERNPMSGRSEAGLLALNEIRKMFPEVRAVVLTDFASQDDLRVKATRQGI